MENSNEDRAKVGFFLLGAFLCGLVVAFLSDGYNRAELGRVNTELDYYRSRNVELEPENQRLAAAAERLNNEVIGLRDGISYASGIAKGIGSSLDSLSSQSGSTQEKLRRVIESLQSIRERLRAIESLDGGTGSQ